MSIKSAQMSPITRYSAVTLLAASCAALTGCPSNAISPGGGFMEKMRMLYKSDVVFAQPPEKTELNHINNLSIKSNEAITAPTTAGFMEELQQAELGGKPYYRGIDMGESETLTEGGALFEITVGGPRVGTRRYQESRVECPGSGTVRTCSGDEGRHYKVNCAEKQVSLTITYNVMDHQNQVLIPSSEHVETVSDSHCSDQTGGLATTESLTAVVMKAGGKSLAAKFTPDFKKRPNDLFVKSVNLEKEKLEQLKALTKEAATGDVNVALSEMTKFSNEHPSDGNLLFNAGYLNQAIGNFQKAKQYYDQAGAAGVSKPKRLAKHTEEVAMWLEKGVQQVSKN